MTAGKDRQWMFLTMARRVRSMALVTFIAVSGAARADMVLPAVDVFCASDAGKFHLRIVTVHNSFLPRDRRATWDEFSKRGVPLFLYGEEPVEVSTCEIDGVEIAVWTADQLDALSTTTGSGGYKGPFGRVLIGDSPVLFPTSNPAREGWFRMNMYGPGPEDRSIDIMAYKGASVGGLIVNACETRRESPSTRDMLGAGPDFYGIRYCNSFTLDREN